MSDFRKYLLELEAFYKNQAQCKQSLGGATAALSDERISKLFGHLINEFDAANNRPQWISVEKFQEEPNEGVCWIVHKGRVKHAYHDHKSMFRFSPWSDNVYMAESITAVQPILTPEPPTQED